MNFLNNRTYVIKSVRKEEVNDLIILLKNINPQIDISKHFNYSENHYVVLINQDSVLCNLSNYCLSMIIALKDAIILDSVNDIKNIIFNNMKRINIISLNYTFEEFDNNILNFAKKDVNLAYNYCLYFNEKFTEIINKYGTELSLIKNGVDIISIKDTLNKIKQTKFNLEDEFLDLNILYFETNSKVFADNINKINNINKIKSINGFEDKYEKIINIINHLNIIYTFFDYNINFVGKISFDLYKKSLESYQFEFDKSDETIKEKLKKAIEIVDMKCIQKLNQIFIGHNCEKHFEIKLIEKLLDSGYKLGYGNNGITIDGLINESVAYVVDRSKNMLWPTNVTCMACLVSATGIKPLSSKDVLEHYDDIIVNKDFIEYNNLLKKYNESLK